ncbi:MAG: primosomal protein N', partial [Lachnospiraceae bacterium]|nr:primosomal protein N' [Lachnospiraceae bacterium]
ITSAAEQDYEQFYRQEFLYRKMMGYPPAVGILSVTLSSKQETVLSSAVHQFHKEVMKQYGFEDFTIIGPVDASPYKLNDIYRKILYIKHENYDILLKVLKYAQNLEDTMDCFKNISFQYDL